MVKSMQRIAVEAIVQAAWGPVRIITTHLEYYSAMQRTAQVNGLRTVHEEAGGHATAPRIHDDPGQPFHARPRPSSAILTGDFNCKPQDAEYRRMIEPFHARNPLPFIDSWAVVHGSKPHPPTAGVFENSWAAQPYCCDFIFVTADLAPRVRNVETDSTTQASDHQPVLIQLS
jgi:endonuclease/exonuclease/phosphatase family metal-dependent hydrolase